MLHLLIHSDSAKYPLATAKWLLKFLPPDLGLGYDIGCKLCAILRKLRNTPLGEEAFRQHLRTLIGLFHCHAHNRLCQLQFLSTYLPGLGLEDLETCERFFSQSNALGRAVRHASIFHRRQAIAEYASHSDAFLAYANLAKFLSDNYKQALDILHGADSLQAAMSDMNIASTAVIESWLDEERMYPSSRVKGEPPLEETLQIEYVKKLKGLQGIT